MLAIENHVWGDDIKGIRTKSRPDNAKIKGKLN